MNVWTIATGIFSLCSLLIAGASLRRANTGGIDAKMSEYVDSLERQVEELRAENIDQARQLQDCKQGRQELQQQNFYLLQDLHELRKKVVE